MTDTRVSLAGGYLAGLGEPDTRVSLVGGYVAGLIRPDTQVSVLGGYLAGHVVPCVTRWAMCWKITRADGQVFAYTSHDADVVYGVTYKTCPGLDGSAVEAALAGEVGNHTIFGTIDDADITAADLVSGLFDGAEVEVWLIPWEQTGEVPRLWQAGTIGTTRQREHDWDADVLSDSSRLAQRALLDTVTPECRWDLGDARCGVDTGAITVAGTVTTGFDDRRVFVDAGVTDVDGWFDYGRLVWLTGNNAGRATQVERYRNPGEFRTIEPMPFVIEGGDTFTVVPGCDKRGATCKTKFSNFGRFGGFPDVPGRDVLLATAPVK